MTQMIKHTNSGYAFIFAKFPIPQRIVLMTSSDQIALV